MSQKSDSQKPSSERLARDIHRAARRHHGAEEKIRIVLDSLRGEHSIAELCRRVSACSATTSFNSLACQRRSLTSPVVAGETPLAGLEKLFRPGMIQALGDAFTCNATMSAIAPRLTEQQMEDVAAYRERRSAARVRCEGYFQR
jgi:transposase-like protein